jgi:hypothetical protein
MQWNTHLACHIEAIVGMGREKEGEEEGGVVLKSFCWSVEGLEHAGILAQRFEKEDRHLLEWLGWVKHGGKVSIMNHVEAGKKHVADLLVSEKDIGYEIITFGSRIDGHRRQQHAQKWGGRRESASTSTKVFQVAKDEEENDKRSIYLIRWCCVKAKAVGRCGGGGEAERWMW